MVLPGGSIAVCGDGVVGCDSVSVAAVDVSGGADGEALAAESDRG